MDTDSQTHALGAFCDWFVRLPMIRVRDLRALGSFPVEALRREVGPFVVIQTPPNAVMQNFSRNVRGARTIAMSTKERLAEQAVKATLSFDAMVVHTPLLNAGTRTEFTFGRAPSCDFVVEDPSVSGKHARLRYDPETKSCTVLDLGSTNGTFVNARETQKNEVKLMDGDSVMLGDATFVFVTVESLHAAIAAPA